MVEEEEDIDIGTGAKGKQGELIVLGELLRRGHQVYTPMVDSGIDCLVDVGEGNYKELQVKYRETEPIFTARKFKPRENFYIVCYLKTLLRGDEFWIIPSKVFQEKSTSIRTGSREARQLRIGKESYDSLRGYYQNFDILLKGASKEIREAVQVASKRVEGPHLKQPDYEKQALEILADDQSPPMTTWVLVHELERRMKDRFSKADLEPTQGTKGKSNRKRWEVTARFAIYQGLKKKSLIAPEGDGWVITPKGRSSIGKWSVESLNR